MKHRTFNLRPKRLALIIGALGTAYAHAQADVPAEARADRSRMADNAAVFRQDLPSSSERENRAFDGLAPSSLTVQRRERVPAPAAPAVAPAPAQPAAPPVPVRTVTASQALDGTNFDSGKALLLPKAGAALDALAARLAGKDHVKIDVVGHTDNQRIAAWLKPTFPTNDALSLARARAVADYLRAALGLPADSVSASGRGEREPVADNGTPQGMARNRRTEIRVSYDEVVQAAPAMPVAPAAPVAAPAAPAPAATIERTVSDDACAPRKAALQPFSISVDGQPLDADTDQHEADRERCVDVALERADIQVKYDPMTVAPALNVWTALPVAVRGEALAFASYTNYAYWLRRTEVRVFAADGGTPNTRATPLAVVALPVGGNAAWTLPSGAPDRLAYLLRVYDADGRFDETSLHLLSVADRAPAQPVAAKELRSGWGETTLALSNIPASGGTVTVSGSGIQPGQHVTSLGVQAPVDDGGRFALRQILPSGPHTVQVTVADEDGLGRTFSRNLSIADRDWFYVAVADLTAGRDRTTGPAQLVTADTQHYDNKTFVDGRAAFYLKGKIKGDTLLTASADTREQPLRHLFSNFSSKDPNYLLRRIDPDVYYPVYGDDSTIADDAPTFGKLYVKLARQDASVMWGNFQTAWTGTELTQFSRGLYGANAQWATGEATQAGDKRASVNVFAAEPGTLPMREEFRGTGGSLYYLHQQDLTQGSERLWIEVRDRDSGLVLERRALAPAQDYDINYLQGRVTLRTPLSSVSDASSLFRTSGIAGNPTYLVTTYEYVPGLTAVRGSAAGVRARSWLNDHVGVGATAYHQGEGLSAQGLRGVDTSLRYSPNTWLNAELARSNGAAGTALTSLTGGFDSTALSSGGGGHADAKRVQAAADLADLGWRGRVTGYWQDRGNGFAGPGQITANGEATRQHGVGASLPLGAATEIGVNADQRSAPSQEVRSVEAAVRHRVDAQWGVSAGVRSDDRARGAGGLLPTASPFLNQDGRRNDAVLRIDYRPLADGAQPAAGNAATPAAALAAPASGGNAGAGTASSLMATATPSAASAGGGVRAGAAANGPGIGNTASGIAGAALPGYKYADWSMYGFVQRTLAHTGDRSEADRVGFGGAWQASERIQLRAEASGGSGGGGAQLGGSYRVNERSDVYLSYTLETERQDVNYGGRDGVLTAGSHYRVNDRANLFAETRWENGAGPQGLTHAFGVDLAPAAAWTVSVKVETGTLSDPFSGDVKRDAFGITAGYKQDGVRATTGVEYRIDRTSSVLAGGDAAQGAAPATATRRSWLTRNSLGWQLDPNWRLLGKLNVARSVASQGAFYDGDYTEFVTGAAYRPVSNDRWNLLFKYTYFYNLPASTQVDSTFGTTLDFRQKSHVLNADVTYDVRPWLSVGAKVGVRTGEVTASRTSTEWMASRATLAVLRSDWHVVREWDGVAEVRRLAVREARDARTGALVGVYRHVGEHAKLGVGHNFTNFSDDLTDLSYRSRGWFINALGTF